MKKLSLILSFLFLFTYHTSKSQALPNCTKSGYFDNCYGSYEWKSGERYEGEWKNNKRHGQGKNFYVSGAKYIGEYKNNSKHGQGNYTYPDGSSYVGSYINGKMHGQGIYIFADGEKYEGSFFENKKEGLGTSTYTNGDKYVGEYKNHKRNGHGTFTYKDGVKEVGEFKNGKLNGFAIRYDKYGNILKQGIWKNDNFLYSQKKTTASSSNSKLDKYKSFCEEIGFVQGTEKFGDCVLEAMKKG